VGCSWCSSATPKQQQQQQQGLLRSTWPQGQYVMQWWGLTQWPLLLGQMGLGQVLWLLLAGA
jgi:hypothetical protein